MISSMLHRSLCVLLLAGLGATSLAAPVTTTLQPDKTVRRVPGREERPLIRFPADEGWNLLESQSGKGVETRSYSPATSPSGPGVDLATITILHDLWNANLEKAQHLFGKQLSADCEGVRARLLRADSTAVPKRLLLWTCESAQPPFSALQLLMQGRDDLFSVELFSQGGILSEGQQVRWADWLWEIDTCLRKGTGVPCPPDNWDRLNARP